MGQTQNHDQALRHYQPSITRDHRSIACTYLPLLTHAVVWQTAGVWHLRYLARRSNAHRTRSPA